MKNEDDKVLGEEEGGKHVRERKEERREKGREEERKTGNKSENMKRI